MGRLTLSAIPFDQPIIMGAGVFMMSIIVFISTQLTIKKKWKWIWNEWITSVDHKKIGIMYLIVGIIMLLRGFIDAIMMRLQLSLSFNGPGYLPPHHYDQIFTVHGVIMIFFMAMVIMVGLFNIIIPLQIGARDVAFPFLNSLSFWMTAFSALLINISLIIGEFAQTGWLAYPPLSELKFSPGVGVDYYLWSLQISGIATLISGINFFVTIIKMRAPGMTMMKLPVFTWTALCSNILIMATFPILSVTFALLSLDRYLGMHFFTNEAGGSSMLYLNLIWAWGHPEVYILILPAFGIYSEVISTFSRKKLFGYNTMVYASCSIMILAFVVWLHHFFTMGSGANVNAFFGIMTMIIAIPTGVKVFNWLFTMYRGKIYFTVPVLWTISFIITFSIGGMTGVVMSIPGADFVLHNSLFLIAHFHNTIIGGVVFGYFAGLCYWFPKIFGFKLDEKFGKISVFLWFIGFYISFVPLYILGFMGMTRRINHYDNPDWHPWLIIAALGVLLIAIAIICQFISLWKGWINRNNPIYKDNTGDPWNGRTLEWMTNSPPPIYNFPIIPFVHNLDEFYYRKINNIKNINSKKIIYQDIHMPSNTSSGFLIGFFSLLLGFGLVWYIWWIVIISIFSIITIIFIHSSLKNEHYVISGQEIKNKK